MLGLQLLKEHLPQLSAVSRISSGRYQCSFDRLCTGSQDLLWVEPGGWTRLAETTAYKSDCGSQVLFASFSSVCPGNYFSGGLDGAKA